MLYRELVHNPIDHALQGFGFHGTTGFANGRQRPPSPVLRTILLQRAHQETIRCADEIHVAGLPLAAAHLTVSQPQLLLAVPMKRLGACPAMPRHQHHTNDFPTRRVLRTDVLAAWSSRSRQNKTILTGCPTSGIRICLLKYQYRLLPTRTGFFAAQG